MYIYYTNFIYCVVSILHEKNLRVVKEIKQLLLFYLHLEVGDSIYTQHWCLCIYILFNVKSSY